MGISLSRTKFGELVIFLSSRYFGIFADLKRKSHGFPIVDYTLTITYKISTYRKLWTSCLHRIFGTQLNFLHI